MFYSIVANQRQPQYTYNVLQRRCQPRPTILYIYSGRGRAEEGSKPAATKKQRSTCDVHQTKSRWLRPSTNPTGYYIISISYRYHIDIISISYRYHIDIISISYRYHVQYRYHMQQQQQQSEKNTSWWNSTIERLTRSSFCRSTFFVYFPRNGVAGRA